MDWFPALLALTAIVRGLGAGMIWDVALVGLPARRRIGAITYATFARANFEVNGLKTYRLRTAISPAAGGGFGHDPGWRDTEGPAAVKPDLGLRVGGEHRARIACVSCLPEQTRAPGRFGASCGSLPTSGPGTGRATSGKLRPLSGIASQADSNASEDPQMFRLMPSKEALDCA